MKIKVLIQKDGNIKINDVEGVGAGCVDVVTKLTELLGVGDENSKEYTEHYEEEVVQVETGSVD